MQPMHGQQYLVLTVDESCTVHMRYEWYFWWYFNICSPESIPPTSNALRFHIWAHYQAAI